MRVSSVNYADEWVLPVISAKTGTQDDFTYNPEKLGDNDKLYENYIMHARHPAMTDNNGNVPNYEQENIVIYPKNLCIAKCDIGNYTYVAKKKLPNGQSVDATYRNNLLGWRFNMVDDDMRDIYYNDSYLKYVHIGNLQGNKECEFKIVSDWTWNTYLSSSFEGTDKFMYDENGYVKYKVNDNKSYYLVNNNNPKDTAHLNQSIIIGASNTYYFSGTIVN